MIAAQSPSTPNFAGEAQRPTPPIPPTQPTQPTLPSDVSIGIPGSLPIDPTQIAQKVENISVAFFTCFAIVVVGLPLARAWARRLDRRGYEPDTRAIPSDLADRLTRIEQAVESIAVEVERVAEGQRFTTKLLSERSEHPALPAKGRS